MTETVAITGAAGAIGRVLRAGLKQPGRTLRLIDVADLGQASEGEEVLRADLTDMAAATEALSGVDTLIHLAVDIREGDWEIGFPLNYQLTWNAFEAARLGGARRIVFASSVQAVGYHPAANPIDLDARIRPSGLYGVYKAFGEALASVFVDKHGMDAVCPRIASLYDRTKDRRMLRTWLSHGDTVRLFEAALGADMAGGEFLTCYGISNNATAGLSKENWDRLGYVPEDNAEDFRAEIEAAGDGLTERGFATHGGDYASVGVSVEGMAFLERD